MMSADSDSIEYEGTVTGENGRMRILNEERERLLWGEAIVFSGLGGGGGGG